MELSIISEGEKRMIDEIAKWLCTIGLIMIATGMVLMMMDL